MGNSYRSGKYSSWVDGDASAISRALSCDQKGANVDVGGAGEHDGLDADVIFTNSRKMKKTWTEEDAKFTISLTPPAGGKKGQILNGGRVTGNPLISAKFSSQTDYTLLGRCNKLGLG